MAYFLKTIFVIVMALLASACSTTRLVDSEVTAFSTWRAAPPLPGTPYRFERLPSQQSGNEQQSQLEILAQKSLAKVGMRLDEAAARYAVQLAVENRLVERFADDGFLTDGPLLLGSGIYGGFGGFGGSVGFGGLGAYGRGAGFGGLGFRELYYWRSVSLQMRDLASNQVVYETRALHDGPWNDTYVVIAAMLDAALLGFPQPPPGPRRIDVQIPR